MTEQTHDILVDFDPLRVTLPGAGPFVGKVRIILPEIHFKLLDLSMGMDLLDGMHIGGDSRSWNVSLEVDEPGITAGEVTQFVADAEEQLKRLHAMVQGEMDKKFLLEKED